ncbi:MAG: hypothetical protein M1318_05760, partial [Firmicutes bacterium]|nr:hypothetical protein [Bacillota bacterium]
MAFGLSQLFTGRQLKSPPAEKVVKNTKAKQHHAFSRIHAGTTEAVLPVKQIKGPLIERSDITQWAGLLIVQGILFDLLEEREQDIILSQYMGFLHTLRFPIQIVLLSTPLHIEAEIQRFQRQPARFPQDPLVMCAQDIARILSMSTRHLETMTNIVVVTAPTETLCQQNLDTVKRGLTSVHSGIQLAFPTTAETERLLALGFGYDNPPIDN